VEIERTLDLGPGARDRVTDRGANTQKLKHHDRSPVPMKDAARFTQPLADGAATIDLLQLPDNTGMPSTLGLRVQIVKVQNPHPHPLEVHGVGAGGYPLSFTVPPKGMVHLECDNLLPPVQPDRHLLTLSGEGAAASHWTIVLG
jgi:hypothetical protein